MDSTTLLLGVLVLVAAIVAFRRDPSLPLQALSVSGKLLRQVGIELLLGFLLAGLMEVLIPQEVLLDWLGAQHFTTAMLAGWGAGLVIPGGPYVFFPVAANLLQNGAAPGPVIALLTGKMLVSPIRTLTYELPLLGWPLTLARLLPSLLLPPILGLVGQWLYTLLAEKQ